MANKQPFNVTILNPDEYIKLHQSLPVTSHAMFESSSMRLHPDGLFSEVIFGQLGSKDRLIKRGYIDLKSVFLSPHLWKTIVSLKSYYQDIAAGKAYAIFDKELKDLVKVPADTPGARTGFAFFLEQLDNIQFQETDSVQRHDKIRMINKYSELIKMTKMIVLPAGVRDVKEKDGRMTPEEINKIYQSLMSLVSLLPPKATDDPLYDSIRYQAQMKIQALYQYILDLINGKGGFAQHKYLARGLAYSSRNVITGPLHSRVPSPKAPSVFSIDEVQVPLYQGVKSTVPLVVNKLKSMFLDNTFGNQTSNIPLIDPSTLNLVMVELEPSEIRKFTSSEGIEELIHGFRDKSIQKKPVTVKGKDGKDYYLHLVYDDGDTLYHLRSPEDFKLFYTREKSCTTANVKYLENLDSLVEPDKCVILGSAACVVFGMPDYENQDIDVIVREDVFERIKQDPRFHYIKERLCWSSDELNIDVYNDSMRADDGAFTFKDFVAHDSFEVDGRHIATAHYVYHKYLELSRMKDSIKIEFLRTRAYDFKKIRPITWVELMYTTGYVASRSKHLTCTRYPVEQIENINVYRCHLVSTIPSRIVTIKPWNDSTNVGEDLSITFPEYPILDAEVKESISVPLATEGKYGADHDGDTMGISILMSDEANQEIEDYNNSPMSMVSATGNLVYGLTGKDLVSLTAFATTYRPV